MIIEAGDFGGSRIRRALVNKLSIVLSLDRIKLHWPRCSVLERLAAEGHQTSPRHARLLEAARDSATVSGLTHTFYRYPARFSPKFVRAAIETFTGPGDVVLDPFVGGGTTLVEAMALGRHALGTDISSLATFISEVKTTLLTESDMAALVGWMGRAQASINMRRKPLSSYSVLETVHYKKHMDRAETWRLRKAIEQSVESTVELTTSKLEKFARCAVLRSAQWALDGRRDLPTVEAFKRHLHDGLNSMFYGVSELAQTVANHSDVVQVRCINRSAVGLESDIALQGLSRPRLVITSPPYPGVHVLYHRWQVDGGKETAVPFWITRQLDGHGGSYYTMGDRKEREQDTYFDTLGKVFRSVAAVCHPDATIVQMVAFASPEQQLPRYLAVMQSAGFQESNSGDERLWRSVPNRRWHAGLRGATASSREVVLIHRLSRD